MCNEAVSAGALRERAALVLALPRALPRQCQEVARVPTLATALFELFPVLRRYYSSCRKVSEGRSILRCGRGRAPVKGSHSLPSSRTMTITSLPLQIPTIKNMSLTQSKGILQAIRDQGEVSVRTQLNAYNTVQKMRDSVNSRVAVSNTTNCFVTGCTEHVPEKIEYRPSRI